MNVARWLLSKSELMHFSLISISISLLSTMSILAAPAATPEIAPTVPAEAAEAGKDVVHQLKLLELEGESSYHTVVSPDWKGLAPCPVAAPVQRLALSR